MRTQHLPPNTLDLRQKARMGKSYAYVGERAGVTSQQSENVPTNHLTPTLSLPRRGSRPPLPAGEGWGEGSSRSSLPPTTYNLPPRARLQATSYQAIKLFPSLTRIFSILLLVLAGSYTLHAFGPSLAYFTDTEASAGSMAVGLLDITVTDPEALFLSCTAGGTIADASIDIAHEDAGFPVYIVASVASTSGSVDLCEAIQLDVRQVADLSLVFQGTSTHFAVSDLDDGTLHFIATLDPTKGPFAQGTMCRLNIGFDAWVDGAQDGGAGGFHDYEVAPVMFTVSDASCTDGGDDDGDECDDPTCCVGDVEIDIINVNTDVTDITIDSTTNTGGNTIISNGGTNTIITGDTSSSITIIGGTQSNVVDIDFGCGCESDSDCDSPCPNGAMIEVKPPSSEEGASTIEEQVNTEGDVAIDGLNADDIRDTIRADIDARLSGRGR